jgi:adenylosuccinate lyase
MSLSALSPLDGRYAEETAPLRAVFSEGALIYYRIHVELVYLSQLLPFLGVPLPTDFASVLQQIHATPGLIQAVKEKEKTTRHDVKAVEYVLSDCFTQAGHPELVKWIHWGLTSEDVNNLAWGCMLQAAHEEVFVPLWLNLLEQLKDFVAANAAIPMLAHTHGQPASPTTIGKEYAVFARRLLDELKHQATLVPVGGKQNGATGNWHVFESFYPQHNWLAFSERFVTTLGLNWEPMTTQIVVRESHARYFDSLRRLSSILIDASRDSWFYVSLGYFNLKRRDAQEVGSSTMPHKVNPVNFENAEGNLELASVLLDFLSNKLTKSRLQRDLSDSTVQRNLGVALGHVLLGCQSFMRGLNQLEPRREYLEAELNQHWEVLAEPLQHALRLADREVPYDQIRRATQGQQLTQAGFEHLLEELKITLPLTTPSAYIGRAPQLAEQTAAEITHYLNDHLLNESEIASGV